MKKVLIVTGVALMAFAAVAAAQGAQFNTNLTVGSTGADVVALQTWLMANGYSIPALSAGTAKGYFGTQTKAAVMAYQAKVGVPNTGFVGPMTRAKLNGGVSAPVATGFTCPVGYKCVAEPGTTPAPVVSMNGTDGSVSVTDSSFVSSGQNIKKGETKSVVAVKLQATAGPVTVTRVDAHFSVRPWLYFSTVKLVDSTGTVLATKAVGSVSDSTEVSVGSDYMVRFDGLNYVVTPGTNPDIAVAVTVLPATDKITNGQTIYAGIPTGAIRTVNGLGYSDSLTTTNFGQNSSGVGARSFTLSSTGSVADISTSLSQSAPSTQVTVPVSATVPTNNVTLGLFSLKSANNGSKINNLNFTVQVVPAFAETEVFSNLRLVVGSQTYGALSFSDAGLAKFTNLNIDLPQDQWTDLKLIADVAATTTNVLASSTLKANTIDAIDSTFTQATVGGATYTSATIDQSSANTLLTVNSVSLSLGATPCVTTQALQEKTNSSVVTAAAIACTFTLTNNSSNNMYVTSRVAGASGLINGTTTAPTGNASSTFSSLAAMTAIPGDDTASSPSYYVLPNRGSRTFTVKGMIQSRGGTSQSEGLYITSIQYGSSTTGLGTSITTGLTTLGTDVVLAPKN